MADRFGILGGGRQRLNESFQPPTVAAAAGQRSQPVCGGCEAKEPKSDNGIGEGVNTDGVADFGGGAYEVSIPLPLYQFFGWGALTFELVMAQLLVNAIDGGCKQKQTGGACLPDFSCGFAVTVRFTMYLPQGQTVGPPLVMGNPFNPADPAQTHTWTFDHVQNNDDGSTTYVGYYVHQFWVYPICGTALLRGLLPNTFVQNYTASPGVKAPIQLWLECASCCFKDADGTPTPVPPAPPATGGGDPTKIIGV